MKEGERRKRKRRGRRPEKTKPGSFSSGNGSRSPQSSSANEDGGGSTVPSSKKRRPNSTKPRAPALSKSSNFLEKMKARLSGGHFRMINEKLYTCSGNEALDYFKDDPSLFDMVTVAYHQLSYTYHAGYQEQMSHWPEQPVNIIIRWLKDHNPSLVVADFGCGDARLAKNVRNKVFSIDLVSNEPSVIACDMANTPLASSSVDVAVFCLSLMGTNFPSYLQEAHRVLKPSGWLLIAEVKSRFDPNTGGADPNRFSKAICELGFTSACKDFSSKMFILLYFKKKEKQNSDQKEIRWPELKPCLYKRR